MKIIMILLQEEVTIQKFSFVEEDEVVTINETQSYHEWIILANYLEHIFLRKVMIIFT